MIPPEVKISYLPFCTQSKRPNVFVGSQKVTLLLSLRLLCRLIESKRKYRNLEVICKMAVAATRSADC